MRATEKKILDEKEEARLLLSVGTHRKSRPFGPIETGRKLAALCEHTPRSEIARRYRLSQEMLREFLSFSKLSTKAQQILDSWEIGIDKIYRISMLVNEKDQETLATLITEYNLGSKEVRDIVLLRNRNPSFPIAHCINLVLKSRPVVERLHLVLTELEESTLESIKEKADSQNIQTEKLLRTNLDRMLPPNSLEALTIRDRLVLLNFKEEGFQAFKAKAKELGVELDDFVETVARRTILRN